MGVKIKATGELKLNDSPVQTEVLFTQDVSANFLAEHSLMHLVQLV